MSKILVRVGGVAAVIAALLIIAQQLWTELVTGPHEDLTDSIMYSSQLLLMVFGVIGIALAQQRGAGVFAQIAALVSVLGCVLWFGASLVEVTLLPSLMAAGSPLVDNPPAGLVIVGLASFVTFAVGSLLLSASIIVTKVLPWQPAAVLGGGIVLGLALSSATGPTPVSEPASPVSATSTAPVTASRTTTNPQHTPRPACLNVRASATRTGRPPVGRPAAVIAFICMVVSSPRSMEGLSPARVN